MICLWLNGTMLYALTMEPGREEKKSERERRRERED